MAIRVPRGGPKAKASSLADREFVPSGYLSLGDAVGAAGKALFGDSWTGDERACRYEDINYRKSQDRRTALQGRRLAQFQEHFGRDWHEELDGDLPILGKKGLASLEWELTEKWAAREEAGRRFDQTVGWLRDRLWSGVIPAVVLTARGTTYPMPTQIWGSYSTPAIFKFGKVEFHLAKYGWTVSPTAAPLKGRVLIKREHMVRALSGEDTSPQETPERSAAGGVAVKPRKKGGRPEKYDWDEFWIEVARIANLPDGLPERQGELVRHMLDWCAQTWEEIPGETTVKDRIRRLYTQAIPKRTET